ncbi:MAG TPA: hypothetical protein VMV43_04245 [Candidatus Nanopelagicaceae bacterium]|nr:hypothetical protein [Candidatus Nanopelagicaceae bacterium]
MTEDKITKKETKTVEIKGNIYFTLEKYLTPIIDRFAIKPDKDFARYLFGIFNEQKIWYYAINGEMCFTFQEFSKYLAMKFDSVRKAFYRQDLIQDKHFFKISRESILSNFSLGHNVTLKKGGLDITFLTFLGVWKLLPSFRGEIPSLLYDWFGERLYENLKTFQLPKGQFFLTTKSNEIIPQILGDPSKNYVDCKGFRYASKGELLIANILNGLGIKFQYNSPIFLPEELKDKLKTKHSCNWSYITADFLIRIVPKTIIEFWGIEKDSYYDWKRKVKEFCYKSLEIKLISIEAHEDQNAPELKKKLRELLNLQIKTEV